MNNYTANDLINAIAEMTDSQKNQIVDICFEKNKMYFSVNKVIGNHIIANDEDNCLQYGQLLNQLINQSNFDNLIKIELFDLKFVVKDICQAFDHHVYQDGNLFLLVE